MRKSFFGVTIFLITLLGCEKESEITKFTGITSTDGSGVILNADEDDWNLTQSWNKNEQGLFTESYSQVCESDENISFIIAYPNPCTDYVRIYIRKNENSRFVYKLVDSDYNILASGEELGSEIIFKVSELVSDTQIVRLYYKVLGADCELKGHGYIKIVR